MFHGSVERGMLRPRKDFIRAVTLDDAVVDLGVHSLVPYEVCEVASTLQTRVPQNMFGVLVGNHSRSLSFGSGFRHSYDLGHNTGSLIGVCSMADRCYIVFRYYSIQQTLYQKLAAPKGV